MARFVITAAIAVMVWAGVGVQAGGWGVITLQNVPEYLIAGQPATLVYTMRQHGHRPMNALTGRIEAGNGSTLVRSKADRLPPEGTYGATLTLPEAGSWTLDVISGAALHGHTLTLEIEVLGRDAAPPPLSEVARGRRLFDGKGCVMCHAHSEFSSREPVNQLNLSKKQYTPDYVKAFLAAVSARPADPSAYGNMPNLELVEHEIDSLAAFLGR